MPQLTTIDTLDLSLIHGGVAECTPENPQGQGTQQFWENSAPREQTQMPQDPRDTLFPPFTRRPPTEAAGKRMYESLRGIGSFFTGSGNSGE